MAAENENEHLLEHTWVLWYRPPTGHNPAPQAKTWESSQKQCFAADTVEKFWKGFHKLPRITHGHSVNCDYSLFKKGVKPMWEDDFNQHGGRWTCAIEKRSPNVIEQCWLDVMLCLIGEGFEPHGDQIAGGVCGLRLPRNKNEVMSAKIHIWTKDSSASDVNLKIGETLKQVLQLSDGQLNYVPHEHQGAKRGQSGSLKL